MLRTNLQPWADVHRLRNEMDRLFSQASNPHASRASFPALNIWEDEQNLYVEAELPGFEMEDLEVYVSGGNQLSISGNREQPGTEGGAWHRQERGFGTFRRTLDLPVDVDSEAVSATSHDGVLKLTLPKSEAAKPRRIQVKSG